MICFMRVLVAYDEKTRVWEEMLLLQLHLPIVSSLARKRELLICEYFP